jgi:hypothetical protein
MAVKRRCMHCNHDTKQCIECKKAVCVNNFSLHARTRRPLNQCKDCINKIWRDGRKGIKRNRKLFTVKHEKLLIKKYVYLNKMREIDDYLLQFMTKKQLYANFNNYKVYNHNPEFRKYYDKKIEHKKKADDITQELLKEFVYSTLTEAKERLQKQERIPLYNRRAKDEKQN